MAKEAHYARAENLPVTEDGCLKVKLVPMPGGDNPWRTREEYKREQRRDTFRFYITILTLITSLFSVAGTTAVAIYTIRDLAP